jgi:SAM-dependent methyltransferase
MAIASGRPGASTHSIKWQIDSDHSRIEGPRVSVIDEPSGPSYGLGHADLELQRLTVQAGLIESITKRWLLEAGIKAGMRVLDVGSGAGDVALLAAELVGATGEVVGSDRATTALAMAAGRAKARSFHNVRFLRCDPSEAVFDQPFDAIVGRYVLMYQPDPVAMVRKLVTHLRPGGLVLFHEPYRDGIRSYPTVPSYDRAWQLVDETLRGTGADPIMGIKLHATFVAAGLPTPTIRMESVIAGGAECSSHIHFEVDPLRTLLPRMERLGLATAAELDIDTYADRVRGELLAAGGVIVGRSEVAAWSRCPLKGMPRQVA